MRCHLIVPHRVVRSLNGSYPYEPLGFEGRGYKSSAASPFRSGRCCKCRYYGSRKNSHPLATKANSASLVHPRLIILNFDLAKKTSAERISRSVLPSWSDKTSHPRRVYQSFGLASAGFPLRIKKFANLIRVSCCRGIGPPFSIT